MKTSSFWLSDFGYRDGAFYVRRSGNRIGLAQLTPREVLKWISYYTVVRIVGAWRRLRTRDGIQIWFAPQLPRPWYVIWAAATWAGLRFAQNADTADIHFYFDDVTVGVPIGLGCKAINQGCADISKSRVAQTFDAVAGYCLSLDPETHVGEAVEKGQINGLHDGRIVLCPCGSAPGKTYEKLIDATENGVAVDWRVSIIGGVAVCVLRKAKAIAKRFSIHNDSVSVAPLRNVFTPSELDLIARFCADMQLDCGAIDVLRDANDGRIYIVDVNKTDTGPAVDLSWRDRIMLTTTLAGAFDTYTQRLVAHEEREFTKRAE